MATNAAGDENRCLLHWTDGCDSVLRWQQSMPYCFHVRASWLFCLSHFAYVVPVLALFLPSVPAPPVQNADHIDQRVEVGIGI